MELKEFVKNTLCQITEGVKDAQDECLKMGGLVNPMLETPLSNSEKFEIKGKYYPATRVNFNIGLAESESKSGKAGIGVFLPKIMLGAEGEIGKGNQSVTNIEFGITVVFPFIERKGKHVPLSSFY